MTTVFQPLIKGPAFEYLEVMRHIAAAGVIPDVMTFAEITFETAQDQKQFGALRDDPLSADGIALLMSYSAESTHPPLYKDMNNKCYDHDRKNVMPYGPFIVTTVMHMAHIEPYPSGTVFRGVKADLRSDYPAGRKVTWHGFCSTTKSAQVLSNPQFCGESGKRTIFAIALTQGQAREITRYSLIAAEDEVLLPPGCRFEVESVLPQGDLTIIQMREIPSKEWIIDLRTAGKAGLGKPPAGIAAKLSSEQNAKNPKKNPKNPGTGRLPTGWQKGDAVISKIDWQDASKGEAVKKGDRGVVIGASTSTDGLQHKRVRVAFPRADGLNILISQVDKG